MAIPRAVGGKTVASVAAAPVAKSAGVHTGAEARERALREAEVIQAARDARAMGQDFVTYNRDRFRLADPTKTTQKAADRSVPRYAADVIILDKTWDDHYWVYEHQIYEPGNEQVRAAVNYYLCAFETQNCPVCPTQRGVDSLPMQRGTYNMHSSIIDITEDTIYDGTVFQQRKRPLVVPGHLHKQFIELFREAMSEYGTIRGMMLLLERDPSLNSAIGQPVRRPDGKMFVMIPEADLVSDFGNEEERDDNGGLIKPANHEITPYNFKSIFPTLDQEYVRRLQDKFGKPSGSLPPADGRRRDWDNGATNGTTPPAPPPRVRSKSSFQPSAAPGAPAATEDDGTRPEPEAVSAATTPRVRSRAATAAPPPPPPTGQPVAPGVPRVRARPAATGSVQRAAGVDKDIPWTE